MHLITIPLVLVATSLAISAIDHSCQQGWQYYGGYCYKAATIDTKLNFIPAYELCRDRDNGKLIIPTSKREKVFLQVAFTDEFSSLGGTDNSGQVWLGCNALNGDVCSTGASVDEPEACYTMSLVSLKMIKTSCSSEKRRVICVKVSSPLRSLTSVDQDDAVTTPRCLLNHTYQEIPLLHPFQCYFVCLKDTNCLSFNLSGKFCQLNNATISQVDVDEFVIATGRCATYNLNYIAT